MKTVKLSQIFLVAFEDYLQHDYYDFSDFNRKFYCCGAINLAIKELACRELKDEAMKRFSELFKPREETSDNVCWWCWWHNEEDDEILYQPNDLQLARGIALYWMYLDCLEEENQNES